jgi:hypothetical protein
MRARGRRQSCRRRRGQQRHVWRRRAGCVGPRWWQWWRRPSSFRKRWHHHRRRRWRRTTSCQRCRVLMSGREGRRGMRWRPHRRRGHHSDGASVTSRRGKGRPGWGRNEPRPYPRPVAVGRIKVEGDSRHVVDALLPPLGEGRDEGIVPAPCPDEGLLGTGEAHGPPPPLAEVPLVVDPEVLPELPSPPLLLPPRGAVVGKVRVGVIVEEARHDDQKVDQRSMRGMSGW